MQQSTFVRFVFLQPINEQIQESLESEEKTCRHLAIWSTGLVQSYSSLLADTDVDIKARVTTVLEFIAKLARFLYEVKYYNLSIGASMIVGYPEKAQSFMKSDLAVFHSIAKYAGEVGKTIESDLKDCSDLVGRFTVTASVLFAVLDDLVDLDSLVIDYCKEKEGK